MCARLLSAAVLGCALLAFGCSSPTTPTLTPLPITNPPATPAPVKPTLSFVAEPALLPNSFTVSANTTIAGELTVTINASGFLAVSRVSKVRGTLLYDPAVLTPDQFYLPGAWLNQDGALTTFEISIQSPGHLVIRIDRPDSLLGVTGSGAIVGQRFTVNAGVRNRTPPLQWTDTNAYTSGFNDLLRHAYGGTITIQ